MNPDLVKLLLNGLSVFPLVASGLLINAFFQAKAKKEKFLALFLAAVGFCIPLQVSDALKEPQLNSSTFLLVVGYVYFIGSLIVVFRMSEPEPKDDRTKILAFVKEEVKNRLHAMGVFDQQILVRADPEDGSSPKEGSSTSSTRDFWQTLAKVLVNGKEQIIPPGKKIVDIFNQEAAKKLLILGAPGAGKTTALLTLARQLYEAAEQDKNKPIPIVLELSSWQPSEEILNWITRQLKARYQQARYQLPEPRCEQFLRSGEFVLLLDGLDELKDDKEACIEAINKFRTTYRYESQQLVVCSRLEDYEQTTQKLNIPGCYALQPLSDGEIANYLKTHKVSHLWETIKTDKNGFLKLARQPLLLDLIRKTYGDPNSPPLQLSPPKCKTDEEKTQYRQACQERLLGDYVEHQLMETHDNRGYTAQKTKHYLEWLAQRLKQEKTTEFLLENIQPFWLEANRRKGYRIATGLIIWLIIILVSGLVGGLIAKPVIGLTGILDITITGVLHIKVTGVILGIIIGLTTGLIVGGFFMLFTIVIDKITPYEVFELELSLINLSQPIYIVLFVTVILLIFILLIGLLIGLLMSLVYDLSSSLIAGLILGTALSLITVLHGSLRLRDKPNQGIWNSGKNGFIITIFSSPFVFSMNLIISLAPNNPFSHMDIFYVFMTTPLFSLAFGIYLGGGLAFIQHFVLRYFLLRAGHIPKDYVGFLKYAEERGLILRNGGSFRFYHDLLREYLAGNT